MMGLEDIAVKSSQNYSSSTAETTASRDYAQPSSGALKMATAALALAGILSGCARTITYDIKQKNRWNTEITRHFHLGESEPTGIRDLHNKFLPWQYAIDEALYSDTFKIVDKIQCKERLLYPLALTAAGNNEALAKELYQAACGPDRSERKVINVTKKMAPGQANNLASLLTEALKSNESLKKFVDKGYHIEDIRVGYDKELTPEVRMVARVLLLNPAIGAWASVPIILGASGAAAAAPVFFGQ